MMLFDAEGKIKRYESPEEILMEFFNLRLMYYERRRVALLQVGGGALGGRPTCPQAPARGMHCKRTPRLCSPCSPPPTHPAPQDAEWEHMRASNKIRFITAVINGTLVINNKCAPPALGLCGLLGYASAAPRRPTRIRVRTTHRTPSAPQEEVHCGGRAGGTGL
jgi:hypothetical protein